MAITFTNKAAGEMKERVENLVGVGSDSIWVTTFHSTCVRILRRYADRIGYDNNFAIYYTDDQKTVMKEVCKRLQIDTKQLKEIFPDPAPASKSTGPSVVKTPFFCCSFNVS